jgi:hypothetical protein
MAATAQAQPTPTTTDPVQRWLARRGACPQPDAEKIASLAPSLPETDSEAQRMRPTPPNQPETGSGRTPFCASPIEAQRARRAPQNTPGTASRRAATNRANSLHSTGPRTKPGKQRSSRNALRHGLTAQTAVLPTEDPETYQRHIQQFLDEYAPGTATETQLVHEIANTAWRLNRIPFLEAELFSQSPNPQTLIPMLATLGLHGSRLSRQFQKALDQLREIQEDRRRLERRQLTEAAELFLRHQHKGLPWDPAVFSKETGFVFSNEQVERHARQLMRQNPTYYAAHPRFQADPPPPEATV